MIKFKSIEWKNFLSTGNTPTQIDLNRRPTTLIVGQNGAGKSTLLDAISFGLFGKPHRDINKPALVNSINKKGCLVSVDFSIGKHEFTVKRGIKPAVFEIWQNGYMINQSSTARDYQKYLEQNVLKLNHKSFHQIVVLGSSSFIPFMQLKASHRREVIEDLLDINIFSKMNVLLKEDILKDKEKYKEISHEVKLISEKIDMQNRYIEDMSSINREMVEAKEMDIKSYEFKKAELYLESEVWKYNVSENEESVETKFRELSQCKVDLEVKEKEIDRDLKGLMKDSKFYSSNKECPTCTQDIPEDFRKGKMKDIKGKADSLIGEKGSLEENFREISSELDEIAENLRNLREMREKIRINDVKIKDLEERIKATEREIQNISIENPDLKKAKKEYETMWDEKGDLLDRKSMLVDNLSYQGVIGEMLKDSGIKTKVIKEYLPVMNKLINKYLQILDFFVSFNLDENFSEYIKSRHRDDFQYESFSEGEKQRIDLALLFTWRHIAKMKNSTNTNLLILDETFDSSMDQDGVESLMKILNTLDDGTNVFVISHKGEILENKFRSKIEFTKDRNFSKIKTA